MRGSSVRVWQLWFAGGAALLFLIGTAIVNHLYWTDHGEFKFLLKWLFLPCLVLAWWLLSHPALKININAWQKVLYSFISAFWLILLLNAPILLLNDALPHGPPRLIRGVLINFKPAAPKTKHRITLRDQDNQLHRWPVHPFVYSQLKSDMNIELKIHQGGLGILFVKPGEVYWELIESKKARKP